MNGAADARVVPRSSIPHNIFTNQFVNNSATYPGSEGAESSKRRHVGVNLIRDHLQSRDVDHEDARAPVNVGTPSLPNAASLFVPSLPGIPNLASHPTHPLQVYAGNLPSYPGEGAGGGDGATGKDATLFFMMVKARRSAGKQRVILWFNGGPGCSSFDGSLMEVGPFRTISASETESGKVEVEIVEGWEEFATIVFIDQPPGTGLSYVPTNGYLHELDQGSQHLITFLRNFYQIFPEYKGTDTYLAGESFAGQYIPYFASALIKTSSLPGFKLSGLAIGNGWIDPNIQYPAYAEFAYEKGLIERGSNFGANLENQLKQCMTEINRLKSLNEFPVNIGACGGVMGAVGAPYELETNGRKTCMNIYDVRLVDDYPACGMNWPPDLSDVYSFLRRADVVSALHATQKETAWVECDGRVSSELHMMNSPAAITLLPEILEAGVPILMFAGAEDLICNYKGIENICDTVQWNGEVGMGNSSTEEWYLNGTQVGTWRSSRGLTYAKVLDSSHMVGFDVPHVTNDMILRFMDVDISLLPGIAAGSKGRIGTNTRVPIGMAVSSAAGMPLLKGGNTDWEAAYNVGSALMILLILVSIVGLYFYFRRKAHLRNKRSTLTASDFGAGGDLEERVPLGALSLNDSRDDLSSPKRKARGYANLPGGGGGIDGARGVGKGKGKGKERRSGSGSLSRNGGMSPDIRGNGRLNENGEVMFALGDDDEDERR